MGLGAAWHVCFLRDLGPALGCQEPSCLIKMALPGWDLQGMVYRRLQTLLGPLGPLGSGCCSVVPRAR